MNKNSPELVMMITVLIGIGIAIFSTYEVIKIIVTR